MKRAQSNKKQGILILNGVILEKHEMATVAYLLWQVDKIELIPKSNQYGIHTPDIKMLGLEWEMKSPTGEGKYLIANTIQKAIKQSRNIVIDLRRTKRHQTKCIREIENEFVRSHRIRWVKVITKNSIIDFRR